MKFNNQPTVIKKCVHCGKEYESNAKSQKYCSKECNRTATYKYVKKSDKQWVEDLKKDKFRSELVGELL